MAWGWSEMVNFMAVTTVVLMRADGDDSAIFSLGSKLTGCKGQVWSLLSSTQGGEGSLRGPRAPLIFGAMKRSEFSKMQIKVCINGS